ncbi:MAG: GtrA family protein [Patescibacteria group bacterium]
MKKFIRYGLVAVLGYSILFIGTFLLVEGLNFSESLSYFFVITFDYIVVYFLNLKFVFESDFNKRNVIKYVIYLVISWAANNLFFIIMTDILNIYYIISILINMALFGLIKFFVQKELIFKKYE